MLNEVFFYAAVTKDKSIIFYPTLPTFNSAIGSLVCTHGEFSFPKAKYRAVAADMLEEIKEIDSPVKIKVSIEIIKD